MPPRPTDTLKIAALALACALACLAGIFLSGCSKREIPTDAPRPTVRAWVPAAGKSMLPTFPESALVEAEFGVRFEDLRAGDTVIFWDYTRGAGLTHHRLVSQQAGNWIAQGDNSLTNPVADRPWVTRDNFIARTTGRHAALVTAPVLPR